MLKNGSNEIPALVSEILEPRKGVRVIVKIGREYGALKVPARDLKSWGYNRSSLGAYRAIKADLIKGDLSLIK